MDECFERNAHLSKRRRISIHGRMLRVKSTFSPLFCSLLLISTPLISFFLLSSSPLLSCPLPLSAVLAPAPLLCSSLTTMLCSPSLFALSPFRLFPYISQPNIQLSIIRKFQKRSPVIGSTRTALHFARGIRI